MEQKSFFTPCGDIQYWIHHEDGASGPALVFLPGLTADHRLFDKQLEAFGKDHTVFVWDAPGHGASRPFVLDFDLFDKARWLHRILESEGISRPVFIGQSMGGYVSQAYCQLFPEAITGFISIDSAPLAREYVTGAELWLMKHIEPVYKAYPWKLLKSAGSGGVAATDYGRKLMEDMMSVYDSDPGWYVRLAGHGYRILAEAMESGLPFAIPCPALLLCGEKDQAGSTRSYNKRWAARTGLPLIWLPGAGHNSNADVPDRVNRLIRDFLKYRSKEY